jgi:hypothetical protein
VVVVGEDSQQPVCGMWKDDNIWFVLPELLPTIVRGLSEKVGHVQLLGEFVRIAGVQLLGISCADSCSVQLLDSVESLPHNLVRIARVSSC